MRDDKFYKIIIVALLVLNMGVLGYLWLGKERPSEHREPHRVDMLIVEKLHLDDGQQRRFRDLKDEHHTQMIALQEEDGTLHKRLFELLKSDTVNSSEKEALLSQLQQNDRRKEEVTFEHFRKLRSMLQKEQQPDFDSLVEEIAGHILGHHPQGPPPQHQP